MASQHSCIKIQTFFSPAHSSCSSLRTSEWVCSLLTWYSFFQDCSSPNSSNAWILLILYALFHSQHLMETSSDHSKVALPLPSSKIMIMYLFICCFHSTVTRMYVHEGRPLLLSCPQGDPQYLALCQIQSRHSKILVDEYSRQLINNHYFITYTDELISALKVYILLRSWVEKKHTPKYTERSSVPFNRQYRTCQCPG